MLSVARDRRSRASTSASTSRAASRSPSRRRSRPRSRPCASRRRRSARATRSSRAAGTQTGARLLQELPDPAEEAQLGQAGHAHDRPRPRASTPQKLGVKNVSASFCRQILDGAILAIIVSFVLIALYVTFRYRWRFAVPILRTLLNDIPIMLGVYAISGREVTADTVAAILTILGYSIYDTIIVFDRIRENMRLMPKASIATIANVSVSRGAEAVDRDLDDHAAPDRRALHLRRRDAAGLRLRDHGRDRGRRRLDDLHRDAAPRRACWSATPSTPAAAARPRRADPRRASSSSAPSAPRRRADARDADGRGRAGRRQSSRPTVATSADAKRERRRQRRQSRPHGRPR